MNKVETALAKLSVAEKVKLVSGASMWRTHPVEGAGVPVLKVSDGPNGVRGDGAVSAASFPVGICMASTWNADLIEKLGQAVAEEAISKEKLNTKSLFAVLDNFMPSDIGIQRDLQTMHALLHCSRRSLIPDKYKDWDRRNILSEINKLELELLNQER